MENLGLIFQLFIYILLGFAVAKAGLIKKDFYKHINTFLFWVAIPALIFVSLTESPRLFSSDISQFIVVNAGIKFAMAVTIFTIIKLLKLDFKLGASIFVTSYIGNTIYFGFPILQGFGEEYFRYGLMHAVFVLAIGDLFTFPLLALLKNRSQLLSKTVFKDIFINPIMFATLIALLMYVVRVSLPSLIISPLESIGNIVAPLALFNIGVIFYHKFTFKKIHISLLVSIIKLLIFPFVALIISRLVGFDMVQTTSTVLLASMPVAVFTSILAIEYNFDEELTISIIILSTVLYFATSLFWLSFF